MTKTAIPAPVVVPAVVLFDSVTALDQEYHAHMRATLANYTRVNCHRCHGEGYGLFMPTCAYSVICFGCAGTGKVITRKQHKAWLHDALTLEVWRLRCLYLLTVQELRKAEAEAVARPHWSTEHMVTEVKNQLARLVESGREKAAQL